MTKNIESKNTSTELFYDLAKRSFVSWPPEIPDSRCILK